MGRTRIARERGRAHPRALDVAMGTRPSRACRWRAPGSGRSASTCSVDAVREAMTRRTARRRARRRLVRRPDAAPAAARRFDLVVVCRYLQRDLFPDAARGASRAGGVVIYETFTTSAAGAGPAADVTGSPARTRRAAARASTASMLLFYEEVAGARRGRAARGAVAQLIEALLRQRRAAWMPSRAIRRA